MIDSGSAPAHARGGNFDGDRCAAPGWPGEAGACPGFGSDCLPRRVGVEAGCNADRLGRTASVDILHRRGGDWATAWPRSATLRQAGNQCASSVTTGRDDDSRIGPDHRPAVARLSGAALSKEITLYTRRYQQLRQPHLPAAARAWACGPASRWTARARPQPGAAGVEPASDYDIKRHTRIRTAAGTVPLRTRCDPAGAVSPLGTIDGRTDVESAGWWLAPVGIETDRIINVAWRPASELYGWTGAPHRATSEALSGHPGPPHRAAQRPAPWPVQPPEGTSFSRPARL